MYLFSVKVHSIDRGVIRMNILVITQYFYPENFRINQLCLDLKDRGHRITVLTGKPNYPKGEYYEGYTFKGNEDERWNDIPIIRVPLRARKTGYLNLIRNYLSFVYQANKKVKSIAASYDLIYVFEVSPITVALPAIKLKKKQHIPIVMNVQDLWPENIIAVTGIKNKAIVGCVSIIVNYIYRHCDLLLAASPSFVNRIQERMDEKEKVKYWPQYSVVKKADDSSIHFDHHKMHIMFTGNIGEAQGIDIAIEAAKILRDQPIHWHFIGDGRQRKTMEEKVKEYGLQDKITFYGFKPESEIPVYLAAADAALLILKKDPVFEMTIPAKLQTYLACGVPIIGCISGEAKKIITDAKAGLVGETISSQSLADLCMRYINQSDEEKESHRINALSYGKAHFDKIQLLDQLESYMEELI